MDAPQPLIFNAWMQQLLRRLLARRRAARARWPTVAPWPRLRRLRAVAGRRALVRRRLQRRCWREALNDRRGRPGRALRPRPRRLALGHGAPGGVRPSGAARHPGARRADHGADRQPGRRHHARPRRPASGDLFDSVHGAAYRGVYDLADLDRTLFVVTPGQSGNPLSRLSRNFVTRWRDGATITLGPQRRDRHSDPAPDPMIYRMRRPGRRPC